MQQSACPAPTHAASPPLLQAATGAPASLPSLLWVLANGMHLPYMLVTGLGWQDAVYNIPMQVRGHELCLLCLLPVACHSSDASSAATQMGCGGGRRLWLLMPLVPPRVTAASAAGGATAEASPQPASAPAPA